MCFDKTDALEKSSKHEDSLFEIKLLAKISFLDMDVELPWYKLLSDHAPKVAERQYPNLNKEFKDEIEDLSKLTYYYFCGSYKYFCHRD